MLKSIEEGAKLSPLALLLNPTFWLAICVWTAFIAVSAADYGAERERVKQVQMSADALEKQARANDEVLARERALRTADRTEFAKYKEEQAHAEEATRKRIADVERDNRRLRVPVRRPVCAGPADAGGTAGPDVVPEGFADLTAGASALLLDLTARGDTAIRKHAAVVDAYERLRLACTAAPDQPTPPTTTE